ncbi:STAS domain-containing protein [Streptomyces sp. NPDC054950]
MDVSRGEIDCSSVSFVGWAFDSGAGDRCAPCTVIDFEHVTFMDCSGISFLVYAHRAAQETDGWLRLARVPQPVQRLLHRRPGRPLADVCHAPGCPPLPLKRPTEAANSTSRRHPPRIPAGQALRTTVPAQGKKGIRWGGRPVLETAA